MPTPSMSWRGATPQVSTASSFTFSGADIGAASATRRVVVAVMAGQSSSSDVTAVSIAGVSATIHVAASGFFLTTAIASAEVPTGTTGDIVVTFGGNKGECAIGVWALDGVEATPQDADTNHVTASSISVTSTCDDAYVIAVAGGGSASGGLSSWTGPMVGDANGRPGTNNYYAYASADAPASPATVQATWASSSAGDLSAVSFTKHAYLPIGLAIETDTALALEPYVAPAISLAIETDTALAMTFSETLPIGMAAETGTALALSIAEAVPMGLAIETDTAFRLPMVIISDTPTSRRLTLPPSRRAARTLGLAASRRDARTLSFTE